MSTLSQFAISPTAHSATVTMALHIGAATYRVVQAGPDAIKVKTPAPISPGNAELEIIVDGQSHRQPIRVLPSSARTDWIAITDR